MSDNAPERRRSFRGGGPSARQLPLTLVILAVFALVAAQTVQAVLDHRSLIRLRQSQEAPIREAMKVHHQLEVLAGKTAELAIAGDAGAKAVVAQMRRQGVTLKPPQQ